MKARQDDQNLVVVSAVLEEYIQKQGSRIEAGLLPSLHTGCHEGIPGISVDEFIDKQTFKTDNVLVGGSKRQDRNERFGPLHFLLFVGYNRDFPRKPGLLFAVMRFISGIHWNIVRIMVQRGALPDLLIMDHNRPTMETVRPSLIRSKKNEVRPRDCKQFAFPLPREEIKRLRNFSQSVLLYGKVDCVEVRLSELIGHREV